MATEQQRADVLRTCETAQSIQELADKYGVHYQTMWRLTRELRDEGLLEELPWRTNGEVRLVTNARGKQDGVIYFSTSGGARPVGNFITTLSVPEGGMAPSEVVSAALAQLWIRSWLKQGTEDGDMTRGFAGGPEPIELKPLVKRARDWAKNVQVVCEQYLLRDELWTPHPRLVAALGFSDAAFANELVSKLTRYLAEEAAPARRSSQASRSEEPAQPE